MLSGIATKSRTRTPGCWPLKPGLYQKHVPGKINTGPHLAVSGSQSGGPRAQTTLTLCPKSAHDSLLSMARMN